MARVQPKTRQVRLKCIAAGPWGSGKKGDVVTVPFDQAAVLLAGGHAEDPEATPPAPPEIPPDPEPVVGPSAPPPGPATPPGE